MATVERAYIFNAVRSMLGRGFKDDEVKHLDRAIDAAVGIADSRDDDWLALAAPLVEQFEGLAKMRPDGQVQAYPDPGTGGVPWTIGIGSTTDEQGRPIDRNAVWTVDRARARFKAHLAEFGAGVDKLLAGKPATAPQKAALTSLAYNIGLSALGGSTVLRKHLAGDYAGAADAFGMWVKAGGRTLPGLVKRRAAEAKLYQS